MPTFQKVNLISVPVELSWSMFGLYGKLLCSQSFPDQYNHWIELLSCFFAWTGMILSRNESGNLKASSNILPLHMDHFCFCSLVALYGFTWLVFLLHCRWQSFTDRSYSTGLQLFSKAYGIDQNSWSYCGDCVEILSVMSCLKAVVHLLFSSGIRELF